MVKKLLQYNTLWVMVITLSGMTFGLLFHVLIPRRFGVGATADALIAALKVVLLVDTIVREGAKFSLVPLFIKEEKAKNDTDYQNFINGILNFSIGIGIVIALVIVVFAPWISIVLLSNSTAETQLEMTILLRLFAPLVIFGCGSTILGAFLNSQKRFKTVALRNALPPGIATVVFFFLWGTEKLPYWVTIAYASGSVVYFVWLCFGLHKTGHTYKLQWFTIDTLRSLKNTITLPTLGFGIRQLSARLLVEVYLIGKLGEGAITLYNSAFRIFSALQTLIGISIATTGLPEMATHNSDDNKSKLKSILIRNIFIALCIALPTALLLLLNPVKISTLLYGRSNLDQMAIQDIGLLLFFLSFGMVFSCLIPVLNAGLYAQREYRHIFRNMVTMAVLNFILAYGFGSTWELFGIALAVSATAVLAVVNLVYLLQKTGISLFSLK